MRFPTDRFLRPEISGFLRIKAADLISLGSGIDAGFLKQEVVRTKGPEIWKL